MGWKQIPVGPLNLSNDENPTLSNDLNTNGFGLQLTDELNNGDYSGVIISGTLDSSVALGDLVSPFGTTYFPSDISGTQYMPVFGIAVDLSGKILVNGLFKNNSLSLPSVGSVIYAGETPGSISGSTPSSDLSGYGVQAIGYVWDDTDANRIIYIKPSASVLRIL